MTVEILAQAAAAGGLSSGGWAMMVGCLSMVIGLCVFCLWRILRDPRPGDRHHVPLDLRTEED